ncbi:hypothetical protein QNA23_10710 [Rhodococcus erythropolis]|uniref:hypothetical protein n=1 Tax=Rhodococcus erythropolis TaxID=1833 RepID=UPI0024BA8B44|nr:hypothetical protein [Rhodococcus erythropolis]MDJ0403953.1 hypothetical protein [Rhodococcus erythropolis]
MALEISFEAPHPKDIQRGPVFTVDDVAAFVAGYEAVHGAVESGRLAEDLDVDASGSLVLQTDFVRLRFTNIVVRNVPGWGVDKAGHELTATGVNEQYWYYLAHFPGRFDVTWIDWVVDNLVM